MRPGSDRAGQRHCLRPARPRSSGGTVRDYRQYHRPAIFCRGLSPLRRGAAVHHRSPRRQSQSCGRAGGQRLVVAQPRADRLPRRADRAREPRRGAGRSHPTGLGVDGRAAAPHGVDLAGHAVVGVCAPLALQDRTGGSGEPLLDRLFPAPGCRYVGDQPRTALGRRRGVRMGRGEPERACFGPAGTASASVGSRSNGAAGASLSRRCRLARRHEPPLFDL